MKGQHRSTFVLFRAREGEAILKDTRERISRKDHAPKSSKQWHASLGGDSEVEEEDTVQIYIDAENQTAIFHTYVDKISAILLPRPSPIFLVYSNDDPNSMEILHKEL